MASSLWLRLATHVEPPVDLNPAEAPPVVQPKLTVSQPGDSYEREADRIAATIVGASDRHAGLEPTISATPVPTGQAVQRTCACSGSSSDSGRCAECTRDEENPTVRRAPIESVTHAIAPPIVHDVLNSPGQPLDESVRAEMEERFGHDFSRVRVHTDGRSATAARALNARAFTVGRDIAFGSGEYAPATRNGQRLLAHELVHVVQQGESSTSSRFSSGGMGIDRVRPGGLSPIRPGPHGHRVQRQTDGPEDEEPEEPQLTRAQEIALSRSSPGEVTGEPEPLTLSLFNFGIDVAQPKTEHRAILAELGRLLHETATAPTIVRVIGFADSTGDELYNLQLSKRRAEAVKTILQPLITQRITVSAFGETNPVASNETVSGRSRNRRVDLRFASDRPPTPKPLPRPKPVPPGQKPPQPGQQPPGTQPPGGGGGDGDHKFCEDYPLLCGLGVVPFFLPLLCLVAPEVCLAATCVIAPELCVVPPPPPSGPPEEPPRPEEDSRPIVTFVPAVRSPNTPVDMNDRIGLRDPVNVTAVVVNPPPVTSPITITVDGTGPNGGEATINGQATVQITGTTPLQVLGTRMSAENFAYNPYLQLAAWWSNDLVGASNRFAVSSIAENWSVEFDAANVTRFGYAFYVKMDWVSDSGAYRHLDACRFVELVGVIEEHGGMVGMGVGEVDNPDDINTADLHPTFDQHGTPHEYTRVAGSSRLKQLFRIRDMRSNSGWAPSSNSGFEIERLYRARSGEPALLALDRQEEGGTRRDRRDEFGRRRWRSQLRIPQHQLR